VGGCGGNGGSLTLGVVDSGSSLALSGGLGGLVSSVRPSEETLTFVIEVGRASLLLDLRLVRNLVGESSFGFFTFAPGSSPVAPPLTPMLSVAVFTIAGALERQLPDPPSHFLPFGVCVPVVVGVEAPSDEDAAVDSASDVFEGAFCSTWLLLGVVEADGVVSAMLASGGTSAPVLLLPPAGAWGFSFDFLRGFIWAGMEPKLGRKADLYATDLSMCMDTSRALHAVSRQSQAERRRAGRAA
jgi:hypothetical protein